MEIPGVIVPIIIRMAMDITIPGHGIICIILITAAGVIPLIIPHIITGQFADSTIMDLP